VTESEHRHEASRPVSNAKVRALSLQISSTGPIRQITYWSGIGGSEGDRQPITDIRIMRLFGVDIPQTRVPVPPVTMRRKES
jgi:hypothetical protein